MLTLMTGIFFTSCKKAMNETAQEEISQEVISKVSSLGFNTNGIQKIKEGYLVEGDIILTPEELNQPSTSPNLLIANEEQYRTRKLVTGLPRNITVSLNTTATPFPAALTEAISRYNAEGLQLTFTQISGNADIDIVTYYQVSNVLGSAGFPSGGNPYGTINMNTYWYNSGTSVNYLATIIAHEMGHCIGMRHTDYMNRAYSCGSGGNEGSGGVGAIHIPGTPTGPDANSWMLACIGGGVNRPFNANDKVALNYLY